MIDTENQILIRKIENIVVSIEMREYKRFCKSGLIALTLYPDMNKLLFQLSAAKLKERDEARQQREKEKEEKRLQKEQERLAKEKEKEEKKKQREEEKAEKERQRLEEKAEKERQKQEEKVKLIET